MLERLLLRAVVQHNKTELNRNSKTEMRWNKKEVSLSSPELREILRPDQGRKETGEHRCSWDRETPRQLVGSTGFPVRRIWYPCGWKPFRPRHRQIQLLFECRNWLRDRPPSRPNTGACLPATESKSDHIIIYCCSYMHPSNTVGQSAVKKLHVACECCCSTKMNRFQNYRR